MELTIPGWSSSPDTYVPHAIRRDSGNEWPETNCYSDLWIELLNGLGADPVPLLAFALGAEFEGDQWTFIKPAADDLGRLYGISVVELNLYRTLENHCWDVLARGNVPIMEVDAYYLPDATDTYQRQHHKTTIAIVSMKSPATATYIHSGGYFSLSGLDYAAILAGGPAPARPETLRPYVESARLGGRDFVTAADAVEIASDISRKYIRRRPPENPVAVFEEWLQRQLVPMIQTERVRFDDLAFATFRQCGAAAYLGSRFLAWLADATGDERIAAAAELHRKISLRVKRILLTLARDSARGGTTDQREAFRSLATAWAASDHLLREFAG